MSDLEKIREWVSKYPGASRMKGMKVDYFSQHPDNGSIDPSGLVEISRTEDILGNVTVANQYNFALYFMFVKDPGDDKGATDNAAWLMDFQRWVQEQSILKQAPIFGDDPAKESAAAQNGSLYAANEEGTAVYTVQLSFNFIKIYEVN